MERLRIVVEHNRFIETDIAGLAIKYRDGFDECHLARCRYLLDRPVFT